MKIIATFSVLAATAAAFCLQPPGDDRNSRRNGPPPRDPFLQLFDTNEDDEISKKEMESAGGVLKKLDKDGNEILTRRELPRPPRPPRPGDEADRRRPQHRGDRPDRDDDGASLRNAKPGAVVFLGGHQTDRRDGGRPVALIAAALGVETRVFRDAFRNVNPSRSGPPTKAREMANKKVLLAALGKHGITNDRLDTVSNYYRYKPQDGGLWKNTPATAQAVIKDGKVTDIRIVNAGSGYMTAPNVVIAGHENVKVTATIGFSRDFSKNGRITSLKISK